MQSPPEDEALAPAKESSQGTIQQYSRCFVADTPMPAETFADKDVSSSTLLSPESGDAALSAPRSPSMPVPAVPRRAAPPRRKTPKSPSPSPAPAPAHVTDAEISESPVIGTPQETSDDKSKELQEIVHKSKEVEEPLSTHQADIAIAKAKALDADEGAREPDAKEASEEVAEEFTAQAALAESIEVDEEPKEHSVEHPGVEVPEAGPEEEHKQEETTEAEVVPPAEEVSAEPEEEEDEDARRQRIAERLRQQGGFNPFAAPPPIRRPSVEDEEDHETKPEGDEPVNQEGSAEPGPAPVSPSPPLRRQSTRRESSDSGGISPSVGLVRRSSVQSVQSFEATPISPPPVRSATRPGVPERKSSQVSVDNVEEEQEMSGK